MKRSKSPRLVTALIVSVQSFADPNVSVMVIMTTLTALVVPLPAAWLMGMRVPASLDNLDRS